MAFSGTYDIATITNPSSALTDFTLIVDLANTSAGFKAAWDTSLNGKGRAVKGDGVTELACDWIDLDHVAKTGLLRVKWSGTLASSGTQELRIYPPKASNTTYAATDTYGQYNTYDSNFVGYWPLSGDFNDRTIGQHNGTGNGGIVAGDTSVNGLPATTFDGLDDYIEIPDSDNLSFGDGTTDSTYSIYATGYSARGSQVYGIMSKASAFNAGEYYLFTFQGVLGSRAVDDSTNGYNGRQSSGTFADENHMFGTNYNGSFPSIYIDGVSVPTSASSSGTYVAMENTSLPLRIGSRGTSSFFNGPLCQIFLRSDNPSLSWIAQEYSQTNDNSTFWGTWVNVPASGGTTYDVNYSDSITLSESKSGTIEANLSLSENITLSESYNAVTEMFGNIADTITLNDSVGIGGATYDLSCSDSITLNDSITGTVQYNVELSENVTLNDVLNSIANYNLELSEDITLSDNIASGDLAVGRLCMTITGKTATISISAKAPNITINGEGCS